MKVTAVVLAGFGIASYALAQSWAPSAGGSWNSAANWHSPAAVPDGTAALVLITNDYASAVTLTLDRATPFTVNRLVYDDLGSANDVACTINAGSGGAGAGLVFAGTLPTISNNVDLTIGAPVDLSQGLSKWGGRHVYLTNTVAGFGSPVYNAVYANMLAIGPLNPINWTAVNKTTGGGTLRLDAISEFNFPASFSVGAGELQLNPSAGTYAFTNTAGFTKLGAGSLRLNNRPSAGPGGSAVLQISAGSLGFGGNISGFGSVTVDSGGALQPNAGLTYDVLPATLAGNGAGNAYGALYFNSGVSTTVTWPGAITLASGGSTIGSYGVTYNTTLSGVISGTGPLTITGRGGNDATHNATFNLNAAATYSGNTTLANNDGIANCTLKLGVNDALPTGTALTLGMTDPVAATSTTLDLNGKNQQLTGLARTGTAAPGKYRVVNTSGTAATLTLNTATASAFDGSLGVSGGANFSLVKQGNATLTLSGTNCAYSGGTMVNAGTLLVNSAVASGTGSVTVNGGATLGGTGTVRGGVAISAGGTLAGTLTVQGASAAATGAALQPGGAGAVGTLAFQSTLALDGAALSFDLPNSGANDLIALTGALTLDGANTLALNFVNGSLPAGTYTLMTYPSWSGSGTLALDPACRNATLNVGTTSVTLSVTGSGAGSALTWVGGSGNLWDINSSAFWNNGSGADVFFDLDSVLFNDSGSASPAVDIAAVVRPTYVVVSNVASAYTFSGAGSIGGAATLTKWGTNTLTLATANTHSGLTYVRGGRLAYGASDALGAGALSVTNGAVVLGTYTDTVGTVTVEAGGQITGSAGSSLATATSLELRGGTVSAVIAGSGAVNATTAQASSLSGANTYAGPTTVGVYGTPNTALNVNHPCALGSTNAGTTVLGGSGATENKVVLAPGVTVTNETLTLDGGASYRAALRLSAAGSATWFGNVLLTGSATYTGADNGGGTLIIGLGPETTVTGTPGSHSIRGAGTVVANSRLLLGNINVNRDDYGTFLVNSTGNTWGTTSINQGIVRLGTHDALPPTAALSIGKNSGVNNSAVLDLNGKSQAIASLVELHYYPSNGTQRIISALPATLIVNTSGANSFGKEGGSIEGAVSLVKANTGSLALTGTNVNSGAYIVSNGTLIVSATGSFGPNSTNVVVAGGTLLLSNSVAIADSATVRIANGGGAKVSLAAGVNETVFELYFDDVRKGSGTYGATGSGATRIDDVHFAGSGVLTVLRGAGGTLFSAR